MKYLLVTQKNQQTQQEIKLAECQCEIQENDQEISFCYTEKDLMGQVKVVLNEKECHIERQAQIVTCLHFIENQKTEGLVESEYGSFNVEIFTHKYRKWNEVIALEYDILNGDAVSDSFRLMFKFKKLA